MQRGLLNCDAPGTPFRSYEKVKFPEPECNNVCYDDDGDDQLSQILRYGGYLPLTVSGQPWGYFWNPESTLFANMTASQCASRVLAAWEKVPETQ